MLLSFMLNNKNRYCSILLVTCLAQQERLDLEKLPEFMVTRTDRYIVVRYKCRVYIFTCIDRPEKVKGIPIPSGDLSIDLKNYNIEDVIETVRKMYDEEAVELVKEVLLLVEPIVEEE